MRAPASDDGIVFPASDREIAGRDDAYRRCVELARQSAGNFYYAFLTLPRDKFRDMCVLYAFMRITDDIGDDAQATLDERREKLSQWRQSLVRALDGTAFDHFALRGLAEIVKKYSIPREHLFDVIDGVAMDLDFAGFETFDELAKYCYHVAGAVGLCCIRIWGYKDERAIPAAIDCGLALQLTNIIRDLGEDARNGRVYLPREDLRRFSFSEADIARHTSDERFQQLMHFEAGRAKESYARAQVLFDYLDPSGKPILAAMLGIYGKLLARIERRNFNVYTRRVRLWRPQKLAIALGAMIRHRR